MDGVLARTEGALGDLTFPLDQEVFERLLSIIGSRTGRQLSGFKVDICPERGAILSGNARSYFAKQVAQEATIEITGLRILTNRIVVAREK
jgi:hypothetical protein